MKLHWKIIPPTQKTIEFAILRALAKAADSVLKRAATAATIRMREILYTALWDSPTTQSLFNDLGHGGLKAELGMGDYADAHPLVAVILKHWIDNIEFVAQPTRILIGKLSGGFEVKAIDSTWRDVLALPQAEYISINTVGQQHVVPWLEWLLIKGGEPLANFFVLFGDFKPSHSRTGAAIMVHRPGRTWQVPAAHQGTYDDNFVTRAIAEAAPKIRLVLEAAVKTELTR